jgi:aspartyl protease family protein
MSEPQHQQKRIGKSMIIAMWLILLGLLTLFFNKQLERHYNPNQSVRHAVHADGVREVVLERNRFGHYVASGLINNQPVTFLLDTGATHTSVPEHIARRIGLQPGQRLTFQTASGLAHGYATRLDSISLGSITLYDLPASINPNVNHDEILLGMSFLKQLEMIQRGNTLTLRQ